MEFHIHLGDSFDVVVNDSHWIIHESRWIRNLKDKKVKDQRVSLKKKKWKAINRILEYLDIQEVVNYRHCYYDHDNQLSCLCCSICRPSVVSQHLL